MKTRFTTSMYLGTDPSTGDQVRVPDLDGQEWDLHFTVTGDNASGGANVLVAVTGTQAELNTIRTAATPTEVTDDQAEDHRASLGLRRAIEASDIPDVEVRDEINTLTIDDVLDADEKNIVRITAEARRVVPRDELHDYLAVYDARHRNELAWAMSEQERQDFVDEYGLTIPGSWEPVNAACALIQNGTQTYGLKVLQDQELTVFNKVAKAKGLSRADELAKNPRADMDGPMGATTEAILEGRHAEHQTMADYVTERGGQGPPWDGDVNPPGVGTPGGP